MLFIVVILFFIIYCFVSLLLNYHHIRASSGIKLFRIIIIILKSSLASLGMRTELICKIEPFVNLIKLDDNTDTKSKEHNATGTSILLLQDIR